MNTMLSDEIRQCRYRFRFRQCRRLTFDTTFDQIISKLTVQTSFLLALSLECPTLITIYSYCFSGNFQFSFIVLAFHFN